MEIGDRSKGTEDTQSDMPDTTKSTLTDFLIQLDPEDIHCGDVLVLFLLCDVHHPPNSKAALSVLHTKMKRSFITEQLLDQVFKLAHTTFAAHAKCLLKIAQGMVSIFTLIRMWEV